MRGARGAGLAATAVPAARGGLRADDGWPDYNPSSAAYMTRTSATAKSAAKEAATPSYEQALDELERLVAAMEAGQLPLDQLLESYRRGAELLGFCRSRLQAIEQQVRVLEGGELKPWEGD